jgi:hypothetical protein
MLRQTIQRSLVAATLLALAACVAPGAKRPPGQDIEIKQANGSYSLSVPASRLTMTLPQTNWSRKDKSSVGGATASPRYFYFEDSKEAGLKLSGWFEPEQRFKGVRAMWEQDSKSFKESGLPEPANVAFEKLGGWDTVMYDHTLGPLLSSHVRAHWVRAGTWIDIHISITTTKSSAENRAKLRALLKDISISEKGGG